MPWPRSNTDDGTSRYSLAHKLDLTGGLDVLSWEAIYVSNNLGRATNQKIKDAVDLLVKAGIRVSFGVAASFDGATLLAEMADSMEQASCPDAGGVTKVIQGEVRQGSEEEQAAAATTTSSATTIGIIAGKPVIECTHSQAHSQQRNPGSHYTSFTSSAVIHLLHHIGMI